MTIRNQFSLIGIAALLICFAVIFFSRHQKTDEKVFLHVEPFQTTHGWGYKIFAGQKEYIRQEYIPAVAGNQAFKSANDALRVGNLVIKKIAANQGATLTVHELDSLSILTNK